MESPTHEKYITVRIVIILAFTGLSTFVTSVAFYYVVAVFFIRFALIIRPDIWLYWINLALAVYLTSRKDIVNRDKFEGNGDWIYMAIKFTILFSMLFPIFSDLIGHAILGYWAPYLFMYTTFVAIMALLAFPVVMFNDMEQLVPIIPVILLFYFSTAIGTFVLYNIVLYIIYLMLLVSLFLTLEIFGFVILEVIKTRRKKKTRF